MKPMRKETALKLMLAAALAVSSAAVYAQEVETPYSPSECPDNSEFLCGPETPSAGGSTTAPVVKTPRSPNEVPANSRFLNRQSGEPVGGTIEAPRSGTLQGGSQEGGTLDAIPEPASGGAAIDD